MTKDKTSRCKYLVHLLKTQLLWDHKPNNNINMVVKDTIPHMCVFNTQETTIQFSFVFQKYFSHFTKQVPFLLFSQNQLRPFYCRKTKSVDNKAITHISPLSSFQTHSTIMVNPLGINTFTQLTIIIEISNIG